MIKPLKSIFFFLILWCSTHLQASNIQFSNYGLKSGLIQGTITDIENGPFGFIWVATADGLHRFDGHSFKVYRGVDQSPGQLTDNYIRCIKWVDSSIWVGTNGGKLFQFEPKTGYFTEYQLIVDDHSNMEPIVQIELNGSSLFLATEGKGILELDPNSGKLRSLMLQGNTEVYDLTRFKENWYAIGNTGLYRFSTVTGVFEKILTNEVEFMGRSLEVVNSTLWVGTYGQGLWKYDGLQIQKVDLPKWSKIRFINSLKYDGTNLWLGTDGGGLMSLNVSTNQFHRYTNNPLLPESVVSNNIRSLHYDHRNILFVGTINGLSVYNQNLQLFHLIDQFRDDKLVVNNNVYSIFKDRSGSYWFGTLQGGLVKYTMPEEEIKLFPEIQTPNVFTRAVRTIYQTDDGTMWIGTRDEGLFQFDPNSGEFQEKNGSGDGLIPGKVIRFILEDSRGRMWVGTNKGLALYNRTTNAYTNFDPKANGAGSSTVYDIQQYDENTLLIGLFKGGLMAFDVEQEKFTNLNRGHQTELNNLNVMSLHLLNKDTLLIGTYGGGLAIYNIDKKAYSFVTEESGLPNNAVYAIVPDNLGGVWLSTNKGICRYHLKSNTSTVYGLHYYLQDFEYNEGAYWKDEDGKIFFGGVDGVNYFNPKDVVESTIRFNTRIVGVSTLKRVLDQDIAYSIEPKVEISFNENLLSIEFTAFAFGFDEAINYQYQLEGFDADWITAGKRNIAYYTKLSPGTYQFKVRAFEQNPGQSEVTTMRVVVLAPYWKQWWFILLCVIMALAVIWFVLYLRTKRLQENFSNKLMEMELKALRGQMNPHFIFNSLNSIQYFILKKEPKEAYTYLSKFSGLMRKILQNSRERFIPLSEEIETLELYLELENLRMDGTLNYKITVDDSLPMEKWAIPTMLIQPFVENAIIHGLMPKENDRNLTITMKEEKGHLVTCIEDNGIGIEASKESNRSRVKKHRSAGVDVTEERLKVLSTEKGEARLTIQEVVEGDLVVGTRVTLITPKMEVE